MRAAQAWILVLGYDDAHPVCGFEYLILGLSLRVPNSYERLGWTRSLASASDKSKWLSKEFETVTIV